MQASIKYRNVLDCSESAILNAPRHVCGKEVLVVANWKFTDIANPLGGKANPTMP